MAEQTEVIIINWRDAQVILAFKRKVTHWDTLRHRGALFYYWYDTCSIVIGWRKRRPRRYFKNRHRFASEVHSFSPSPHRTLVLSLSLSLSRAIESAALDFLPLIPSSLRRHHLLPFLLSIASPKWYRFCPFDFDRILGFIVFYSCVLDVLFIVLDFSWDVVNFLIWRKSCWFFVAYCLIEMKRFVNGSDLLSFFIYFCCLFWSDIVGIFVLIVLLSLWSLELLVKLVFCGSSFLCDRSLENIDKSSNYWNFG